MARYLSASDAASLVLEHTLIDSGDESDIEEDPDFPLPCADDDESAGADHEQPHLPFFTEQPLPRTEPALAPGQSTEPEQNSAVGSLSLSSPALEEAYNGMCMKIQQHSIHVYNNF